MTMPARIRLLVPGLALVLAPMLVPATPVAAQSPDFLFHRPTGTVSFYGGWSVQRESSDLFDFVRDWLTVEQGDFSAPVFGGDIGFQLTDRLDAVLGLEWAGTERRSEYRDWVEDGWPIEQTTSLSVTRLNATGRLYLLDRGQTIGTFAWVPTRWSPYVGGGGGVTWYTFEQWGDFVDYQTIDDPEGAIIFTDSFRSSRSGVGAHALAGLEFSLTRRVVLRGEYRYNWGSAAVDSRAFDGFQPIDLSGHRGTIGIATRF
jgi:opacity protein-like surface antigen